MTLDECPYPPPFVSAFLRWSTEVVAEIGSIERRPHSYRPAGAPPPSQSDSLRVGDLVLVASETWPSDACHEHNGAAWSATIRRLFGPDGATTTQSPARSLRLLLARVHAYQLPEYVPMLFATVGMRKSCDLQSGLSQNFTIRICVILLPES